MSNNTPKKKDLVEIAYRLRSIKVISFSINSIEISLGQEEKPILTYLVETSYGMQKIYEQYGVRIKITAKRIKTDEVYANFEAEFLFDLQPNIQTDDKNNLPMPNVLITTFVSIALATSRGILFEKGAGTLLQLEPLPVISLSNFIKEIKSKKANKSDEKSDK